LPDGLFKYQNSQFGKILEGHGIENVGVFYVHLKYFTAIWYDFLAVWQNAFLHSLSLRI
jgi:hypothetical protein